MDVLVAHVPDEATLIHALPYGGEALDHVLRVFLRDDSLAAKHAGMGDGGGYVLAIHPPVDGEGRAETLRELIHIPFEPAGPKRHGHPPGNPSVWELARYATLRARRAGSGRALLRLARLELPDLVRRHRLHIRGSLTQ